MSCSISKSNSKRLARNTLMLYLRSFFVMAIGLFTSRVTLKALGVDDYGTYNIVGGFVSFFGLLSGTLVATTQRYLNFELGKSDSSNLRKIFATAMCIHLALALVLLVLMETVGLWFLNYKLNIPEGRVIAANWVFQFSILSFLINIISTPYNAVIIAHEKMSAFAYISVLEAILKLVVAYLLYIAYFDRLIVYSLLLASISLLIRLIYQIYCKLHFEESKFYIVKERQIYKEMLGFASMNFIGAVASLLSNHGMNIVLNIFFGVTVNASRGIAVQVQHATVKFVTDFMTALNPQITKEYASGNKEKSKDLCFRGSKFSFFLMLILSLPLIIRMSDVLQLWLGQLPDYAIIFSRCTLILSLCSLLSNALITEILATGNLTSTTFWIGGVRLMTLPIAYILFKLGCAPVYAYVTLIGIEILSLFVRLFILEKITKMNFVLDFIVTIGVRALIVGLLSSFICYWVSSILPGSMIALFSFLFVSMLITSMLVFILGMTNSEKKAILVLIKNKIKK